MSTNLFDFLQQPLPLQLRRAQQLRADDFGQSLVAAFAAPLSQVSSEPQRFAATERLLFARRRIFDSTPS